MWGWKREIELEFLTEIVQQNHLENTSALHCQIFSNIQEFTSHSHQTDDITVVVGKVE